MATWKKVIVSGSDISQLNNDSGYLASDGQGIVSGSAQIAADISGSSNALSSSIALRVTTEETNVDLLQAHQTNLLAATGSNYDHIANLNAFTGSADRRSSISGSFTEASSSLADRITDQEVFSSSLDATFATDAEINSATASLSSSLATDIATNVSNHTALDGEVTNLMAATGSQFAHISNLNAFTASAARATAISGSITSYSSSAATRITDLEVFSSSLDDNFTTEAELNSATQSLSSSLAADIATNVTNHTALDGEVTNLMAFTASAARSSAISGSITTFSSSIASRVTTEEGNVDVLEAHVGNIHSFTASADGEITALMSFTASAARNTAISGAFTDTSASIASDIAGLEAATTVLDISGSTGNDQVTVGTDAIEFVGEGPITTVVTNNTVTFDVTDAHITGSSTALSSSVESRLTTNESEIDDLQTFSSSFDTAFNLDGANVTIAGDLTVQGTQTAIDSNVLDIGDNIIALNGTAATFGGLAVNDATAPDNASGSLLWDATNDYWIAGPSQSEAKILLETGDGVVSGSGQLAADISGSSNALSSSLASRVTTEEGNVDVLESHVGNIHSFTSSADAEITALMGATGSKFSQVDNLMAATGSQYAHITNLLTFTGSADRRSAISGSFTQTSASIAQDIADITTSFTLSDGSTTDSFESGQTLTFTGAGPITATVSDNEVTFDVTDATISGSFTEASSSLAARITANEVFSASLDDDFVNNTELNTATQSLSSSLATDIATNVTDINSLETFSSSLSSTIISYTGSFSGDGSSLTNITVEQNATVSQSFTNAATASIVHNFGSDNVMVVAYENDEQFIPSTIRAVDDNTVELHFSTNTTGRAIVARGGHIVSGSIPYSNLIAVPDDIISGSDQLNQVSGVATTISGSFTATSASIAEDIAGISTSFDIAADSGTSNAVNSTETLTFAGAGPIVTSVADNTVTFDVTDATISGSFTSTSASIATDIADLPTLAEVNTITSSLSSSLATDIATRALEANVSGAFTSTSASIATDIAGISTSFTLAADNGSDDAFSSGQTLTFAGTSNEVETTVSNNQIQIGIVTNPTLTGDVTITGDLTVTGDTFENQVTNLNVEDQFILLNSGSSAADAGFVVNGQGAALGWDESENRFALDFEGATWNQTTITSDAYVAAVVTTDDANYQKVGNIRIDGDDIYIYS